MKIKYLVPVLLLFAIAACRGPKEKTEKPSETRKTEQSPAPQTPQGPPRALRLATTTSTENSGLLDFLLPPFEKKYNVDVQVLAEGTGKALKLGENGDVDVVLVHSRKDEDKFVEQGFGVDRRDVMYNDFVILGPESDPAGIKGLSDPVEAMKKIAESKSPFASRGDDSGTHKRELELWADAGVTPGGGWHMETGQGMGQTLTIADEKTAYALCDRGTFIAYRKKIKLVILVQGGAGLMNPYGIIAVNPERNKNVNYADAEVLIEWMTSPEGRKAISDFKIEGETLFFPGAIGGN